MAQTVRDQLAREVADIETATATLRKAEPALEYLDQGAGQYRRQAASRCGS